MNPLGEGDVLPDGTGPMPPVGNIDPGGLQTSSTASTAVGLGLVAASDPGDTVASLLRLATHPQEVVTAGISMASIGHCSLLTAGLVLIGLGIVLNVASLVIRRQNRYREAEAFWKAVNQRARALAQGTGQTSRSTGNPNG